MHPPVDLATARATPDRRLPSPQPQHPQSTGRSHPSRALPLSGARANSSNPPDRRGTRGSESPPRWGSLHIPFLTPTPRPRARRARACMRECCRAQNKFRLFLYHKYIARARAHQRGYDGRKAATPIVTLSSWCARPSSGGLLRRDIRTPRVWLWGGAGPRPCGYQWGHSRSIVYAWWAQ